MADRLADDEDFVNLKRFNFSLRETLKRYPEGVPDHLIAQALGIEEDAVSELYDDVVLHLRELMKVEDV